MYFNVEDLPPQLLGVIFSVGQIFLPLLHILYHTLIERELSF